MAKSRLTTPILLGMAFGAGNNQTRAIMALAIGLMTVRSLAVGGYRLANANRSFRRIFEEMKAGRLDRALTVPKPSFPKPSSRQRIIYWFIALAIACTLFFLKADLISLEILLALSVTGSIIDLFLLANLKIHTRRMLAVSAKLNEELAKIRNGPPSPPKPSFGRALPT